MYVFVLILLFSASFWVLDMLDKVCSFFFGGAVIKDFFLLGFAHGMIVEVSLFFLLLNFRF
ncbi:hypothetical protein OIU77_021365 [Salix suchowensis]|uniref:Uncharacterized protein n=1 Tax=Salix suchowensis TaxID=1278906 RepID=A0ABQ9C9Q0_9ROSI|nr:hypothetical protein OIU77_021365 [Salix suchowensis]